MSNNNFTVNATITKTRVEDLLCSAYEGGSNYWAESDGPYTQAFEPGGVILHEFEEDEPEDLLLDVSAIEKGLGIMAEKYPRHFANFLSEDDDSTTGDVFLQCCLLGEIVYG